MKHCQHHLRTQYCVINECTPDLVDSKRRCKKKSKHISQLYTADADSVQQAFTQLDKHRKEGLHKSCAQRRTQRWRTSTPSSGLVGHQIAAHAAPHQLDVKEVS